MDRLSVGRILSVRGLRGEMRLAPASRNPERFASLRRVYVEGLDGPPEGFAVRRVWQHKGLLILTLEGIDSIEQAEPLVGRELFVPAEEAVALDEDEYFVHDLLGLEVYTDTGRHAGVLEQVIEGPANDIYVVRGPFGELLVPAIGSVVLKVEMAERRMLIHDLPGLLEPEAPI